MNRYCLLILFPLFLSACMFTTKPRIEASTPVIIDSAEGSCPHLTRDSKGNIVLSWVKTLTDSSAVFCYATSTDGGNSFGRPVVIPSSNNVHPHSENIPKVIFKPSGEVIALWGSASPNPKNKYHKTDSRVPVRSEKPSPSHRWKNTPPHSASPRTPTAAHSKEISPLLDGRNRIQRHIFFL